MRAILALLLAGFLAVVFRRSYPPKIQEPIVKPENQPERPKWSEMDVTSPQFRLACSQIANDLVSDWRFKLQIFVAISVLGIAVGAAVWGIMGTSVQNQAQKVEDNLREVIAEKMSEPNISSIIQDVAVIEMKEVAAKEASTLLINSVQPTIDRFQTKLVMQERSIESQITWFKENLAKAKTELQQTQKSIDDKMGQLTHLVEESKSTIEEMQKVSEFQKMITLVLADDRKAFDQLVEVAKNIDHPNRYSANGILRQILSNPIYEENPLRAVDWKVVDIDPDKATLGQFKNKFSICQNADKIPFLKVVWNSKQINREEKIQFFQEALTHCPEISTLAALCVSINQERKSKQNFLMYSEYIKYLDGELIKIRNSSKSSP